MLLLADRFFRDQDRWFDIATAEPVAVSIRPAGPRSEQIAWAERGAMLVCLRHSLLNPLVDYGVADRTSFFEAYAMRGPLAVAPAAKPHLVVHLERFLEAHGIPAPAPAPMRRSVRRVWNAPRRRPLGIVLQPRRALHPLVELLAASRPGGTTAVRVTGSPGSGLKTFATSLARAAREQGYVPVCPRALLRWPDLLGELAGRHVCLITPGGASAAYRAAAAILLTRLALRSARPHVHLSLRRVERADGKGIHLDTLGTTSMTMMAYVDSEFGPSAGELFDAARRADGLPGRFLQELAGKPYAPGRATYYAVHETAPEYGTDAPAHTSRSSARRDRSRLGSLLWRAGTRASLLAGRGRHAAAIRLLTRAARVLEARGERPQAARYWRQLAWIARNRGAVAVAEEHASRARQTDPAPENQIAAACLTAVCWTDRGRLLEAEASLRSLVVAASEVNDATVGHRCVLALARVLNWQGRTAEVLALVEPLVASKDARTACESRLRAAKARAATGDLRGALHGAREATAHAAALGDSRLRAQCALAMAETLCAAGDLDGVRGQVAAGLEIAASGHLPLITLRLRAALLRSLEGSAGHAHEARRLRVALERALRRPLPALVAARLQSACRPCATGGPSEAPRFLAAEHVEAFLDVAHRSKDDLAAVQRVTAALSERLAAVSAAVIVPDGRTIAAAGRPWREKSVVAAQALGSGRPVTVDPAGHPPEAAEPVRCGGELIAALACRWIVGGVSNPESVGVAMRAAALAMATHLRAVLDTGVGDLAASAWGDLLGESAGAIALREAIQRASRAPFPVLIEGESGSGKELVARAVHRLSSRHTRRFCAINCAALTDELVEAELFGHTRGAFTGATTERAGLFEEADGGTLFLDEIGELSARAQAKLLRVLQEGEVRRIGENHPRRVDVRIVAATNRRLEHEATQGRFRTDLRFRLDVLRIVVPPLRERVGDIPILAQHFWKQACARVGSSATLGPDALAALSRYGWPGNVRELQNAIAWLAVHSPRRGRISAAMLPAHVASSPIATGSFEAAREEFERRFVRGALAQAGGHRQIAARALGVSRQGLAKMLRRLGLEGETSGGWKAGR